MSRSYTEAVICNKRHMLIDENNIETTKKINNER